MKPGKTAWIAICIAAVAIVSSQGTGHAAIIGSISTPDAVNGYGGWAPDNGGFMISYNITGNGDGTWTYSYSFSDATGGDLEKEISHWILQVSDGFTLQDNYIGSTSNIDLNTYLSGSPSNPGLPGDIFGIKFDGGGSGPYTFTSDKDPVLGNFYAKDGTFEGLDTYAFNSGWNGGSGFIFRPDSTSYNGNGNHVPVPEPGTFLLIGSGLIGLAGWGRKKIRK